MTPLQMARFYAAIANGGRVVTPHVVLREQPGKDGADPIVRQRFPPTPPHAGVDPGALGRARRPLPRGERRQRHVDRRLRQLPGSDRGQDRDGGEGTPRHPSITTEDQAWWCGWVSTGRADGDPELVVCALIENGGHGGDVAAPAALKVFESCFHVKAVLTGHTD